MTSSYQADLDDLEALGHASLALINTAILLALLAVVLVSPAVPMMIRQGFGFLAWLVGNTVAPVTGGVGVDLDKGSGYIAGGDQPFDMGTGTPTAGAGGGAGAVAGDVAAIIRGMQGAAPGGGGTG